MIVIVVGMHRSGTSALAGLLHNNGILMGYYDDFFPPPMRENPKGFFENRRFRAVNDQVLREFGYNVKSFDPVVQDVTTRGISESAWSQMVHLITKYSNKETVWGWKDPRTCLTLWYWLKAIKKVRGNFDDLKLVHVYSDPTLVAQSMRNRGNKEKLGQGQFETLAKVYDSTALKFIEMINKTEDTAGRQPLTLIDLDFTRVLNDVDQACQNLSGYLGMPIENKGFIDPEIANRVDPK